MASGIINLTTSGSGSLAGRILWESVSNGINENTSTVTARLQVCKPNGYTTSGTWKGSLSVGSETQAINRFESIGADWFTLAEVTATVGHNANGSGSCYLSGKTDGPTETTVEGTAVSGSATVTLETITRFASLVSAPDFHDEENPRITFSNPAGSSVTALEVCISFDGTQAAIPYRAIANKRSSSYTFSLSEAERDILRASVTEGNSRSVYFMVRTIIGSASGVSSLARTFTVKDPQPVMAPTITDCNDAVFALTNDRSTLIRYCSDAAITFGARAVKQAAIASQRVTCGSRTLTQDGILREVESDSFYFTVTDSRGNTVSETITPESGLFKFVNYSKLTCDLENNMPDTEGNMTVQVSGNYFAGSFGVRNNPLWVYFRYKATGDSNWTGWLPMNIALSQTGYTATAAVAGLDYQTTYTFEAYAQDALATVYSAQKAVKATPVFDWGEDDFRFNVPVQMAGNRLGGLGMPVENDDAVSLQFALQQFARAGYGLGTAATALEDLNTATESGWYRWESGVQNAPVSSGVMLVLNRGDQVVQLAFLTGASAVTVCLRKFNGLWGSWEYWNPPMIPGVAYRTPERWDNKAVYTRVIGLGQLPEANSLMTIPIPKDENGTGPTCILRISAHDSSGRTIPYVCDFSGTLSAIAADTENIVFFTGSGQNGDYSGQRGWVSVFYTKD